MGSIKKQAINPGLETEHNTEWGGEIQQEVDKNTQNIETLTELMGTIFPTEYANKDADKNTKTGIYRVYEDDTSTNYPTSTGNGILVVFSDGRNSCAQVFFYFDGSTWIRMNWFGEFYSWKKITV